MKSIVLTTTVHDPEGIMMPLIVEAKETLQKLFKTIVFEVSPVTQNIEQLNDLGIVHIADKAGVGYNYLRSVMHARSIDSDYVFYCDIDRIVHWANTHFDELKQLIEDVQNSEYQHVICGRTVRAYQSHHEALYVTEQIPNDIISNEIGETSMQDYLAGAYIFSKKSADVIINLGELPEFEIFGSWPVSIANADIEITYKQCEGLEWETPDRYAKEVAEVGGIDKWKELHSDKDEWEKRRGMAGSFVNKLNC